MALDPTQQDLQSTISFILELEKLKGVLRKIKPLGQDRYENSAEHSWQVALLAISLAEYSNEPIETSSVIQLLLVHDIAEIDTGDTMVYDVVAGDNAESIAAAQRIFGLLPEAKAKYFLELWHEFEFGDTAEARFARAMDRAIPILQNLNNNGQSWQENGISLDMILHKNAKVAAGCKDLWVLLEQQLEAAVATGVVPKRKQ